MLPFFSVRITTPRRVIVSALLTLAIFSAFSLSPVGAQGVAKQTFPRLGGYHIARTPFAGGYSDPEYHKEIARLDFVIFGAALKSNNDDARAIRALNPDIFLAKYTKLQSVPKQFGGYSELKRDKVFSEKGPNNSNAADWWARDFDGNQVSNWPANWTVNITNYVQPDASGDRFPQWAAKLDYEWWLQHDVWDAVFEDSVHWRPRRTESGASVDWSGGKEKDSKKIQSAFRLGHQAYWNKLKELAPDKYIIVNHDWYMSENDSANGALDLPEYDKQVHGGILEIVMRSSDLVSPRTPWNRTLERYRRSMTYFVEPKLLLFLVQGEPDNYRFFRYAFSTCLLDDGYFDYAPDNGFDYGTVEWFDEFDLAGKADTNWLGLAIDSPPTTPWRSGVWRRDFQGGVALTNPKGNGRTTVTIEDGFRRIAGKQDRQVNNGQKASSITLEDGDGIILVREAFASLPEGEVAPKPPVLMSD